MGLQFCSAAGVPGRTATRGIQSPRAGVQYTWSLRSGACPDLQLKGAGPGSIFPVESTRRPRAERSFAAVCRRRTAARGVDRRGPGCRHGGPLSRLRWVHSATHRTRRLRAGGPRPVVESGAGAAACASAAPVSDRAHGARGTGRLDGSCPSSGRAARTCRGSPSTSPRCTCWSWRRSACCPAGRCSSDSRRTVFALVVLAVSAYAFLGKIVPDVVTSRACVRSAQSAGGLLERPRRSGRHGRSRVSRDRLTARVADAGPAAYRRAPSCCCS